MGDVSFFCAALEFAKKHRGAKGRWWKSECSPQYKTASSSRYRWPPERATEALDICT